MKHVLFSRLALLMAATLSCYTQFSCKKESIAEDPVSFPAPTAAFSMSDSSTMILTDITFTNTSKLAESYHWDFGDGNTSEQENPRHQYAQAGNFTVTLTATGPGGTSEAKRAIAIANPQPVAQFSFPAGKFIAPAQISFQNESQYTSAYTWEFGDGESSTEANPLHRFEKPGAYTVTLTARGPFGEAVISKQVVVESSIIAGHSADGIRVGMTFGDIKSAYPGISYNISTYYISGYGFFHYVEYPSLGLTFGFVTNSIVLADSNTVLGIFVEAPYTGYTEKGIRVGSLQSEVVQQYGAPEEIITAYNRYEYPSKGINFTFANQSPGVTTIFISEPHGFLVQPNILVTLQKALPVR